VCGLHAAKGKEKMSLIRAMRVVPYYVPVTIAVVTCKDAKTQGKQR
jgi:hypothetical protein